MISFYVHVKYADSYGEDGNYDAKREIIERFDSLLPKALELKPDVLVVTGDHSTPSQLKSIRGIPCRCAVQPLCSTQRWCGLWRKNMCKRYAWDNACAPSYGFDVSPWIEVGQIWSMSQDERRTICKL